MTVDSIDDLKKLKEDVLSSLKSAQVKIKVGLASCGKAAGADKVYSTFTESLSEVENIYVEKTGCIGFCAREPLVEVVYAEGDSVIYENVTQDRAEKISHYLLNEQSLASGALGKRTPQGDGHKGLEEVDELGSLDFYSPQKKVVLENSGEIDPERLEEYVARSGYFGLWTALHDLEPAEVIEEVKSAGLRGRGGASFPTGIKWESARKAEDDQKYIICNAHEGDPGAYLDRRVLEGDPFSILEGLTIGAYAIGASKGYIYIDKNFDLAIARLVNAIRGAKEAGLLGDDIMGQDFDFSLEIKRGATEFVCGEETALMASIESDRAMPRPQPPFPVKSGLWGKPTVVNNVKTLANIPRIIHRGADWFSSIGTEKSKGTKVLALTGTIENTGLVEVPMGTTVEEVVYDIGGAERGSIKAIQTGGPDGGVIPSHKFEIPIDYEAFQEAGSAIGSGEMIVVGNKTCIVELTQYFLEIIQDECCGKCPPGRIGTRRTLETLEKFTKGKGEPADIDKLEELAHFVKDASLCGLGKGAANPVLSSLQYFRDEYEAHLEGECPAGVCFD